ncbi:pseudouridine synthase [Bacteroidetes bacterium endosymbiont of Geopemphigus sp.]|uniref:pseudouridine synthase n=1 Tax=Bacteroidetes bacterium endosymbiont of Geopemphigus sp. TaxID=2047937 RepID=UPI000CD1E084|nr:pseudouridine synthase [Bacteroidetes bacterium endosymbiont of Geopemphigus sp.]
MKKKNFSSSFSSKRNSSGKKNFSTREKNPENSAKGIRLNQYLAHAGVASRREADELIKTGIVEINGKIVTKLGYRVLSGDRVKFDGRFLYPERKVYVLLNKPKGFLTTTRDEKNRKTVMDLIANASPYRLYPVGRLDRQTTGVLLLTNDGDLAKKMTHPAHQIKKIYHVVLDRKLQGSDFEKIREGVRLPEGKAKINVISYVQGATKNEIGLELHIGWNRVVRRIFEVLGYEVTKLDRVSFGGLTKKALKRGQWRILTEKEVSFLKIL